MWSELLAVLAGVMEGTSTGALQLDKRYSPSFRDEQSRPGKRKRDDVLRSVPPGISVSGLGSSLVEGI